MVADHDVWARADATWRNAEVLSLPSRANLYKLPALIPDGVTTLVLGFNEGAHLCFVTSEVWSRLDCLIVNFHHMQTGSRVLFLRLGDMGQWLVTLAKGHLMLTDPDDGRSVILRNAASASTASRNTLDLCVTISGEFRVYTLGELLACLGDRASIKMLDLPE